MPALINLRKIQKVREGETTCNVTLDKTSIWRDMFLHGKREFFVFTAETSAETTPNLMISGNCPGWVAPC